MSERDSDSSAALTRLPGDAADEHPPRTGDADVTPDGAPASPRPRRAARPRRALAAPGRLTAEQIARHARALRGEADAADASVAAPDAEPHARADLSDLLDRLGSPHLGRVTAPLAGTLGRLLPARSSDERREAVHRRRRAREERRRREREEDRRRAAEAARRRAEETALREREYAERLQAARSAEEVEAERARAEDARRAERERHRQERLRERRAESQAAALDRARRLAEARDLARAAELRAAEQEVHAHEREVVAAQARLDEEERRRQERAEAAERRRQAALLARRRRQEERRRRRREAERARREAAEARERRAREEAERRETERARREREATVAAERARVQAERRAREEAEAAERERTRAAAEAERRRVAAEEEARRLREEAERRRAQQEAAEAERRQRAEEEERRRRAEELARQEAERARREELARRRRLPAVAAERQLAVGVAVAHRRRAEAARVAAAEAEALRAHQARETRALMLAARELDGPELVPSPERRPALASPEEGLDDDALLARARQALPEWRRRERLATKAAAVQALSADARRAPSSGPATGAFPLVPGYTPPSGPVEQVGRATARDRLAQLGVTAAFALFVLASAWGLGLAGLVPGLEALDAGSYRTAQEGRYRADATVLSLFFLHPAVWPVLWALLGLYALHQWAPRQGAAARQRSTRWPVAAVLVLTAAWFPLAVLVPWGLDSLVWLAALALMVVVLRRLTAAPARTGAARFCTDGTLGTLAGLLLAAAPTTVATAFAGLGAALPWLPTALLGTLAVWAVLLAGFRLALEDRGRVGLALGMSWTLLCLALPRLLPAPVGSHTSAGVGLSAAFGALALLLAVMLRRTWVRELEEDAAGPRPTA